uniref:Probable ATP-dependent RNA helicase DDX52 n=1 Tax=Haemonchus contortus TaxID=6289 RepID=A0A7I4XXK3_HAECO|nr:DNA RNA helicase domain containing protein [Haemonchus contortus]
MRDDIFKRLTFGIKKTPRQLAVNNDDSDGNASLRLRVLPENIKEELRILRKRQNGEQLQVERNEDDQTIDEGFKLFSDGTGPKKLKSSSKTSPDTSENIPAQSDEIQKQIADKIHQLRRSNRIYTWGEDIPDPFIDFSDLNLPSQLMSSLNEFGIGEPTPIQMQAIPLMMMHRDILASAPTGSGKTLAFAIPVLLNILKLKKLNKYKDGSKLLAIVLEPTRELASQTYRQFLKFGQGLPVKAALFETEEVPQNVDILVSTPNRLAHHLQDMQLKFLRWLIVDESDRLFEVVEGQERCFRTQLASVYKACDGKFTRRAFFSATFSYEVEEWCKENLNNVAMVCIGERNSANANVTQELVFAGSEQGKLLAIRTLLQTQFEPPALIFVQSKERARELLSALSSITPPIPVALISSEKSQSERDHVIESFRSGRLWVLISTELMGRGLDLRNVNLVINFDLPTSIVSYIHRIGRTGRAGRRGRAITYFTESDTKYLRSIATVIHQAGFEVPEYTLSLKPLSRNEKKQLVRHAPKRKHIAFVKKKKKKNLQSEKSSNQSGEPAEKKAKVDKAGKESVADKVISGKVDKKKKKKLGKVEKVTKGTVSKGIANKVPPGQLPKKKARKSSKNDKQ